METIIVSTLGCGNYSRLETIQGRKLFAEIRYPDYFALDDYLAGKLGMFIKDLVKLCIERRYFRKGFTPLHSTAQYSEQ